MHAVNPTALPVDWSEDSTSLVDSWQTKGSFWNAQVKAVAHQFQEKMMAEVVSLDKGIFDVLRHSGATFHPDPFQDQPEGGEQQCFCGASFCHTSRIVSASTPQTSVFRLNISSCKEQFVCTVADSADYTTSSSI